MQVLPIIAPTEYMPDSVEFHDMSQWHPHVSIETKKAEDRKCASKLPAAGHSKPHQQLPVQGVSLNIHLQPFHKRVRHVRRVKVLHSSSGSLCALFVYHTLSKWHGAASNQPDRWHGRNTTRQRNESYTHTHLFESLLGQLCTSLYEVTILHNKLPKTRTNTSSLLRHKQHQHVSQYIGLCEQPHSLHFVSLYNGPVNIHMCATKAYPVL